jgi:uncharacterized protein (TIGR02391 family)
MDGHYSSAVFEAFKAVEVRVSAQSDIDDTGRPLMAAALSDDGPIQLAHEIGESADDEQEGFKLLFMGAIQGIRNPKAHSFVRPPSPQRAVEYLSLASLMFRRLDDAIHEAMRIDPERGRLVVERIEAALPVSVQARVEGILTYPSSGVPPATVVLFGGPGTLRGQLIRTTSSIRVVPFVFDSVLPGQHVPVAYAPMSHATMVGTISAKKGQPPWLELAPGEVRTGVTIENWVSAQDFGLGYIGGEPPDSIETGYDFLA